MDRLAGAVIVPAGLAQLGQVVERRRRGEKGQRAPERRFGLTGPVQPCERQGQLRPCHAVARPRLGPAFGDRKCLVRLARGQRQVHLLAQHPRVGGRQLDRARDERLAPAEVFGSAVHLVQVAMDPGQPGERREEPRRRRDGLPQQPHLLDVALRGPARVEPRPRLQVCPQRLRRGVARRGVARCRDAAVRVVERGRDAVLEQHEVVRADVELLAPEDPAGLAVEALEDDARRLARLPGEERGGRRAR